MAGAVGCRGGIASRAVLCRDIAGLGAAKAGPVLDFEVLQAEIQEIQKAHEYSPAEMSTHPPMSTH